MVQIVSDKPSDWICWVRGVVERLLDEHQSISKMVIIADVGDDTNTQIIEFMNCSTNDVYYLGGVLQKEAIKHELVEEFGISDDEHWEEFEEDYED